jgi:hypothetical protein
MDTIAVFFLLMPMKMTQSRHCEQNEKINSKQEQAMFICFTMRLSGKMTTAMHESVKMTVPIKNSPNELPWSKSILMSSTPTCEFVSNSDFISFVNRSRRIPETINTRFIAMNIAMLTNASHACTLS